ncbi:nucleotidyltransferase family protein [Aquihabitans daechungensis]|uniref:nucleotidyltransferase family protein n=1 Tax=Aquihabitans daechungensis TaxID=1052257 RepID=UPI003BA0B67F
MSGSSTRPEPAWSFSTTPATPIDLSGGRAARVRRHRREIIRLAKAAGATNVRIFGSVARGADDADSDIDLLVDYDVTRGLIPLVALKRELEELLSDDVDVAPFLMLKPHIAEQALLEAVPL